MLTAARCVLDWLANSVCLSLVLLAAAYLAATHMVMRTSRGGEDF